jgi:O-antigen/teichoic acid export membrane protein
MKRNQIVLNALTTIAQELGSAAVLFLLYRLLFRTIGIERLGIWSLVLATTSVVTLANQGYSTSIVKFVSKYVVRDQAETISLLVQTALVSVGTVLALACLALYPAAQWLLKIVVPPTGLAGALVILPWALFSLWINVCGDILLAGLAGHQLITQRNYVVFGGSAGYLLLACLFVPRYGLLGLAYAQTLEAVAGFLVSWMLLRRQIPRFPLIPHRWSRAHFIEIVGYGSHFQFITVCQAVREPVTKIFLTNFGGLTLTGFYDLASRYVVSFRELIVQANQVLVPTIANLQERDPDAVPRIYRESYRLIFFLAIPTFAFLVVVSPVVSLVWLGSSQPIFVKFTVILAAGWLINSLSNAAYVADLGTGALRWVSVGCATTAILNLALGFIGGKRLGGSAIVAASAFSLAVGYVLVVFFYHRENRLSLRELLPRESAWIVLSSVGGAMVFLPIFCTISSFSLYSLRTASGFLAAALTIIVIPMWIHPLRKRVVHWVLARVPA